MKMIIQHQYKCKYPALLRLRSNKHHEQLPSFLLGTPNDPAAWWDNICHPGFHPPNGLIRDGKKSRNGGIQTPHHHHPPKNENAGEGKHQLSSGKQRLLPPVEKRGRITH